MTMRAAILLAALLLFNLQHAASQQPGNVLWSATIGGSANNSSPALGPDGTIYAACGNAGPATIYSLSPAGATNWIFRTGQPILGSPSVAPDGTIYGGSLDGKIYSISPGGTTNWTFNTGAEIHTSPALASDGTLYLNVSSNYVNRLLALRPDGRVRWVAPLGTAPPSYTAQAPSPAIGPDGTIYIISFTTNLYAFTPNGALKWSFHMGAVAYGSPAVGPDGTIYVGEDDGKFFALSPSGLKKWQFQTTGFIECSPAVGADGTIYFSSSSGLYALSPSGGQKWRYSASFSASPALDSTGAVYIGAWTPTLFYTLSSTGTAIRTFTPPNSVFASAAIGADGTVYLIAGGKVFALYGTNTLQASSWPMFRHDPYHTARALQLGLAPPQLLPDGTCSLALSVEPGVPYHLDVSSNLVNWQPLPQFVPTNSPWLFIDTPVANSSQRFYRLASP